MDEWLSSFCNGTSAIFCHLNDHQLSRSRHCPCSFLSRYHANRAAYNGSYRYSVCVVKLQPALQYMDNAVTVIVGGDSDDKLVQSVALLVSIIIPRRGTNQRWIGCQLHFNFALFSHFSLFLQSPVDKWFLVHSELKITLPVIARYTIERAWSRDHATSSVTAGYGIPPSPVPLPALVEFTELYEICEEQRNQ